ncbi:hypothetical protein TcWFU_010202 [Taenia crassiceps]|uniref:Uncharacterized protein n=1 Tax=Taenia crassiceps TaxID=6207 RepID=A0ABR4QJH7_9CEST
MESRGKETVPACVNDKLTNACQTACYRTNQDPPLLPKATVAGNALARKIKLSLKAKVQLIYKVNWNMGDDTPAPPLCWRTAGFGNSKTKCGMKSFIQLCISRS